MDDLKNQKPDLDKKPSLNRDFQTMSYSRMIFSGLGNLVLLIICFWIHWGLGIAFLIFWLFILPYLDLRRLRKREAENPPILPKSDEYDDSDFFKDKDEKPLEPDDRWKSWDDWDDWKKDDEK